MLITHGLSWASRMHACTLPLYGFPGPLPWLRPEPAWSAANAFTPACFRVEPSWAGGGEERHSTALCSLWGHGFPPEVCLRGWKDFL